MINKEEYQKIDIVSIDSGLAELVEAMKSSITNREKMYSYLKGMYLEINEKEQSIKVSLPEYNIKQFKEYIDGLVSSAIAIGFQVYIKEE